MHLPKTRPSAYAERNLEHGFQFHKLFHSLGHRFLPPLQAQVPKGLTQTHLQCFLYPYRAIPSLGRL